MKFTPKTDEQIEAEKAERLAAFKPWPAGLVVDYEIKEAIDATSKAGNDMIAAHIDVYNDKGDTRAITMYFGDWNDYHFSRICRDRYEAGQVDSFDLPGKTGKCILGIDKGQSKGTFDVNGKEEFYSDRNTIKEFLKPSAPITKGDAELDDSIPF